MSENSPLRLIGERAADFIQSGMIVGLGTGSTAEAMIHALGRRVANGLTVTGVTTSERTSALARSLDIPLMSIDEIDTLDICIDGADEIDPNLDIVKGRGGALLWEKLTARRAKRYVIIASSEKLVIQLGTRMPLPIEIIPHGWRHTSQALLPLGLTANLRMNADGTPYITDGGHYIVDCLTDGITNPRQLATDIKLLIGVVDHGLFVDMVDLALTVNVEGTILETTRPG
ncbi:MAG: ribose-5-phosphate isomerase RpiA [Thermomicrobiales bacterium]